MNFKEAMAAGFQMYQAPQGQARERSRSPVQRFSCDFDSEDVNSNEVQEVAVIDNDYVHRCQMREALADHHCDDSCSTREYPSTGIPVQKGKPKTKEIKNLKMYTAFYNVRKKNPVMALMEICDQLEWTCPAFKLLKEEGMPHQKKFQMEVVVLGKTYVTGKTYRSKKEAKAEVARYCLESIYKENFKGEPFCFD